MVRAFLLLAHLVVAGCQFPRPTDIDLDAQALDAPTVECTPSTASCTDDRYSACNTTGQYVRYEVPNRGGVGVAETIVMHDFECPLGCADATRCADPIASHGLAASIPRWDEGGPDVDLATSGGSVIAINTDLVGNEIELADAEGHSFRVPTEVVSQAGGPDILVLKVRTLTIRAPARVVASGGRALAIAASFDIVVAGRLDTSGVANAAGAMTSGPCVAIAGGRASGGGGNVHTGGASSDIADTGGEAQPAIQPLLVGGCGGGPIEGLAGGFAGGAIQLDSRTRIAIADGGVVSVAGGGGRAFYALGANRATGGGSGGAIFLEAPIVQIAPSARVVGRGGSGSAAAGGQVTILAQGVAGDDDLSADNVPSVTCSGCGYGGDGGTTGSVPSRGTSDNTGCAGGGGSVGRATIATRTGAEPPPGTMLLAHQVAVLPRT